MLTGRYELKVSNKLEVLRLDISDNEAKASGIFRESLKEDIHWFVPKLALQDTTYMGRILNTEHIHEMFRGIEIRISPHGDQKIKVEFDLATGNLVRVYSRISEYFHKVNLEIDEIEPHEKVVEFDTSSHKDRPENYNPGLISVQDVFRKAGFDIDIKPGERLTLPSGLDDFWEDNELYDAMETFWSKPSSDPDHWSIWVLVAGVYKPEYNTKGIMFDKGGSEQRNGATVFHGSNRLKMPFGVSDAEAKAWLEREKFFLLCHEMAHCFNLGHKKDHYRYLPWAHSKEEGRKSFTDVYTSTGTFFSEFRYEFRPDELTFIRHAPENMIRMGGDDYLHDDIDMTFTNAFEGNLKLSLVFEQEKFEFMEPVMVDVQLENMADDTVKVDRNVLKKIDNLKVVVRRNGGPSREWKEFIKAEFEDDIITLGKNGHKGSKLRRPLFLSGGGDDWIISEPGVYEVRGAINVGDQVLFSSKEEITILPPVKRFTEEVIAQDYFESEVGHVMAVDGSITKETINEVFKKLIKDHKDSKAAIHARVALAMPQTFRFKQPAAGQKKMHWQNPNLEFAILELSDILIKNRELSQPSLGTGEYNYYFDKLIEILQLKRKNCDL